MSWFAARARLIGVLAFAGLWGGATLVALRTGEFDSSVATLAICTL